MSNAPLIKKVTTANAIDDATLALSDRQSPDAFLDFAEIGNPDLRTTWLRYRWCLPAVSKPEQIRAERLNRLFEYEVIALARAIPNLQWYDENEDGRRFRFENHGGHFAGTMSGAVLGVPESTKLWHVAQVDCVDSWEFKMLWELSSYRDWDITKFSHVQACMGASGMTRALVIVYNKDTSEIYCERIKAEGDFYQNLMLGAGDILEVNGPPDSIYEKESLKPDALKDKQYRRIYFGEALPAPNCRNCKQSQILYDGGARWYCHRWNINLDLQQQRTGCDTHLYLPSLMPAKKLEDSGSMVRYQSEDGAQFINSEDTAAVPGQHTYDSQQLYAITSQATLEGKLFDDPVLKDLIERFDGTFEVQEAG